MMRSLALACLVVSCAAPPSAPVPVVIPADLQRCPVGPSVPLPPTKPRTIEALGAWGNHDEIALRRALAALAECDRRRAAAVEMIEVRPQK